MELDIKERAERASEYFASGWNCSQAVFMAYSDVWDMTPELAARVSCSFGGGMGRMGEVCGAVSGMFFVASMHIPVDNKDREAKKKNYQMVRTLADEFRKENGSIICRELLGGGNKRPCKELVRMAAEIVGKHITEEVK